MATAGEPLRRDPAQVFGPRQTRQDPSRGFVELPGTVHKKHECPPDRVAMMQRLEEIQGSYNRQLANQRQVIENLSNVRKAVVDQLSAWQEFARWLRDDYTGDFSVSEKAGDLLRQQGVE